MSWIIGRSAGSTQPSLGRVSLSLHSYQNPQFGMTINNIPLLEIKDFGPPARGGHFVLFHSFLPPRPYGTQFHTAHIMDCKQKKDKVLTLSFLFTLEEIRTPDLLVRSQTLYPTELRAHILFTFLIL